MKIIDSHLHFYDYKVNQHPFLNEIDPNFIEFVGDYKELPRKYVLTDYLKDTENYSIEGVVWHEFLSSDPIKEAKWAQQCATDSMIRQSLVALIDFLDPSLEEKLQIYQTLPNVTAIREHMVWDENNPRKRFAKRADLLRDSIWQKNLSVLDRYDFKCGLEVFAPQLPDLIHIVQLYPNIGFTVALMGWPLDISESGYQWWRREMQRLSRCPNVCIEISAMECIFGMNWTLDKVRPWILTVIELFKTERCMFGSHLPIAKLSRNFSDLYSVYENIVADFSLFEQENLFYRVASDWFKVG